jgi:hypothetical protein
VEECRKRRGQEELQKSEELIERSHRQGHILRTYVTRSWDFREEDVMIEGTLRQMN